MLGGAHALWCAYLAYLVLGRGEGEVDPTRVHIARDQQALYFRLAARAVYYTAGAVAMFFGLVFWASHALVQSPAAIQRIHETLGSLFGPVFAHHVRYRL